jgi:3-oxoadipate enol-lactonase
MTKTEINGVQIHYEVAGEGPPVVFLHGLMGSIARARLFGDDLDGLAARGFRLVTYDARGHGESGFTEDQRDYSWAAHAEDMRALLDELGIERACIGGGSMGAGVSLAFALAHPERVEKLVLIAAPPLSDTINIAQQVFGSFAAMVEAMGLDQAVALVMQIPQYAELEKTDRAQFQQLRDWLLSQHPRAVIYAIRGLLYGPPLPADRFGEIRAPALIVAHRDDPVHPQSTSERLHEAIAGSRLVVVRDQNYYREHHDELVETVAGFLGSE